MAGIGHMTPSVPVTTTTPGGTRTVNMPVMPTPSGSALVQRFLDRMPTIPPQVRKLI